MNWIKITKENIAQLKPGNKIKYYNGFKWCEGKLNQYNLDAGWLLTGIHSETRELINKSDHKFDDVFVSEEDLLKNQQPETSNPIPDTPRFLFAPDPAAKQLYIIHTWFPLSVILVQQEIPAKLFIIESELYIEDEENDDMPPDEQEILEQILLDAAEWYRSNAIETSN